MSQENLNKSILWFGDLINPSGFGRIGNEVCKRLTQRGWQIMGMSIQWNGFPLNPLPFPVVPVAGQDIWGMLTGIVNTVNPALVVVCQDFPYAQTAFHGCKIDWSRHKFLTITPIDGSPVHPEWVRLCDLVDGTLVISEFGVEAMRMAGQRVGLLPPGVDANEFYPAKDGEVAELRGKVGIPADAFVMGMFAMNQGRKAVSATVEVFREFARDKPDAYLYLDMEKTSPAGWDLPNLFKQMDPGGEVLNPERVKFREDAFAVGMTDLRDRYLLCDVNSVISHREGFGLPLVEAQACQIAAMALDYCSGPEIVGGGRGALVRRTEYMEHGTWGHARDAFPDMKDWLRQLNRLYEQPGARQAMALKGYESASQRTWDKAADIVETELKRILSDESERHHEPNGKYYIPAPGLSDDGAGDGQHRNPDVQRHPGDLSPAGVAGRDGQPANGGNPDPGRRQPGHGHDRDAGAAVSEGAEKWGQSWLRRQL